MQRLTQQVEETLSLVYHTPVVSSPTPSKQLKGIAFVPAAALALALNQITCDVFKHVSVSDLLAVMAGAGVARPCFNFIIHNANACLLHSFRNHCTTII